MSEERTCKVHIEESFSYRGDTYSEGQDYEVGMGTARTFIGAGYATEARVRDEEHSPVISDSEEIDRAGILPVVGSGTVVIDNGKKEVAVSG